jgi:TrmH family RNA methyltransferase
MDITSLQNERIKHIVKLREDKRQRIKDGLMLVEGYDEIQLAVSSGHNPQTLLTAPELVSHQLNISSTETRRVEPVETLTVSRPVFEKMSYRDNPDGWLAVFSIPHASLDDLKLSEMPLVIVAESVEKPGNLCAILRTADAAQVDALLVCDPRVDVWNPNVVRASRGAVFSVPVVECENVPA